MTLRHNCPSCSYPLRVDDVGLPLKCVCGYVLHELADTYDDGITLTTVVVRGTRYLSATAKWVAHGCPTRSDDAVESIFREHCSQCEYFHGSTCTHKLCGCQVRDVSGETQSLVGRLVSTVLSNKLRWRTERCPDGRWS